jgi:hypothetical protein
MPDPDWRTVKEDVGREESTEMKKNYSVSSMYVIVQFLSLQLLCMSLWKGVLVQR